MFFFQSLHSVMQSLGVEGFDISSDDKMHVSVRISWYRCLLAELCCVRIISLKSVLCYTKPAMNCTLFAYRLCQI